MSAAVTVAALAIAPAADGTVIFDAMEEAGWIRTDVLSLDNELGSS